MTSLQQGAGSNKSAKFVAANPLDPMLRPFGEDDAAEDEQQQLARRVNERLERSVTDLQERHANGTQELDHPDRAPTGPAYQAIHQQRAALRAAERGAAAHRPAPSPMVAAPQDEDDDSDLDEWLDDPALDDLREHRLGELQAAHAQRQQDLARGHGEVRTIRQDDFLTECTGTSAYVAVHFYSDDFARCAILDHHLTILAPQHVECKFLRLDATKAPFFIAKLQIRTLPTLVIFCDGKAVDRLVGFDALLQFDAKKDTDEWPTRRLAAWLAQAGAISYTPSPEEMRQDLEGLAIGSSRSKTSGSIYRGTRVVDEDNM